jgi:[methyl-Co(III) methanol-specific corrinoid protein]:coenzyme M methyltransferase
MSPKRRFLAALFGGPVDRVPVGNVVSVATVELMDASAAPFPQAHLQAAQMAALAGAGHTQLGYDTVMPVFSVTQEAAALGCQVDWGNPARMPAVRTHPFAEMEELHIVDGWLEHPAIQVVLQALTLLRRQLGERVAIVGKVMGPWTLSYHMMGLEEFLVNTVQEPERAKRSLQVLKEVPIAFAKAQMRAGADVICLADHATGGMVSPLAYRDLLLPIHQEIIAALGCPTVLHCCGNTRDRLQFFAQAGFDCYHFESQVKVEEAVAAGLGRMTAMGNINNPQLLLAGTPDQVAEASEQALDRGVHILAPECAVPLTTPARNLRTLVEVAERRRRA